jgi:hypothetical protein
MGRDVCPRGEALMGRKRLAKAEWDISANPFTHGIP